MTKPMFQMKCEPIKTFSCLLLLIALSLAGSASLAQGVSHAPDAKAAAPAAAPLFQSELGFSYGYPSGWEEIDTKPMMPAIQQQAAQQAGSDEEKRAAGCAQIALMLKHGAPASIVMVMALPFGCFGQTMPTSELPGFGMGVSKGLKAQFDIQDSDTSTYAIGSHDLWIERSHGNVKGQPDVVYTIETVCSIVKKAAVCWVGMAHDEASLAAFEQGKVSLEGESLSTLVPAGAFAAKKP